MRSLAGATGRFSSRGSSTGSLIVGPTSRSFLMNAVENTSMLLATAVAGMLAATAASTNRYTTAATVVGDCTPTALFWFALVAAPRHATMMALSVGGVVAGIVPLTVAYRCRTRYSSVATSSSLTSGGSRDLAYSCDRFNASGCAY